MRQRRDQKQRILASDLPSVRSIRVRCRHVPVRLVVSAVRLPVPFWIFYYERKVPMDKKRPDGPVPGPVPLRQRHSTEVRVSLAAAADGLGSMVWIAAGYGADGCSVRGDQLNELGMLSPAMPGGDVPSGDELTGVCQRGGFGWTGAQFYKPDEGT